MFVCQTYVRTCVVDGHEHDGRRSGLGEYPEDAEDDEVEPPGPGGPPGGDHGQDARGDGGGARPDARAQLAPDGVGIQDEEVDLVENGWGFLHDSSKEF